ncbi:hypothetical protein SEA_FORZA_105 [Gordonia phage Forza]|uniref:LtfC/p132/Gp6 beta-sandwich domain-containing protein n=1 Tax=Gordonia phage Forza TaxID=2571247 RepID=A0A650EZI8_9CAUD|nr:hypothetical protein PP303_gp105 [Gordonia phage Forza]QEM41572.1 hypothetical protein SEA_BOOPY_105 [Gordonia phage Boopy]QGT55098.1 hypothetical protein SEA_FORZA_105 [Gordonia phage Forza]UXE04246.1 hypothetical protein SEA_BLUENGOLD_104 [Gordonia phage BlueNGold]WBF03886.1 hypothetical protein SEA_MAREELIH_103 [Gordonia phage Mareelih]
MTTPIFGNKPKKATMYLARDADFIHDIEPELEAYPTGMEAWFEILNAAGTELATWPAVVTSNKAAWNVQSDAVGGVNAVTGATKFRLFLRLDEDPTREYLWYYGSIKWEQ